MIQVHYNVQHKIPWHLPAPAYLVTSDFLRGLLLVYALGRRRLFAFDAAVAVAVGAAALVFTAITAGLLLFDLERPERFFKIITRPQWRSWLTRCAFLLIGLHGPAGSRWLLEASNT